MPRKACCLLLTTCSPAVGERFAALGLHDVHAFAERVGLALVRGIEAGVRGSSSVGAANQPESHEGNDVGAHDDDDEMLCAGSSA